MTLVNARASDWTGIVTVRLKPGREKPVLRGHPWVFSGAIASVEGTPAVGSFAEVHAHDGTWLARGLYHPDAMLSVRLYTRDENEPIGVELFRRRLDAALRLREALFPPASRTETNAGRLVFSESDGLSGLTVDRYADVLVARIGAAALVPHIGPLLDYLAEQTGCPIHVQAEPDAVEREGLDETVVQRLREPPAQTTVTIREHGRLFEVDLAAGQKTGYFLDQRDNRARVARYALGRRVLSAYCYTGSFEVHAAAAGATAITGLDRSEAALAKARRNHELNGTTVPMEYVRADVPEALRRYRDAGATFDLIILDPPRFVTNQAQKEKGLRAYKDINLLALKLLTPGGILATFSCSGLVRMEDFRMMLGWAAADSGRMVRILERLGQPADHPVLSIFSEGDYLKGLICHAE